MTRREIRNNKRWITALVRQHPLDYDVARVLQKYPQLVLIKVHGHTGYWTRLCVRAAGRDYEATAKDLYELYRRGRAMVSYETCSRLRVMSSKEMKEANHIDIPS